MNKKQSAWRSPWVVAWVAILVVFVLISGVRIFLAIDTNPGLVVEDYYERGQDYEQNRLKREARDPGWRMEIEAPAFVDVAVPTTYGFRVVDREGKPVSPEAVTFYAYRPADAGQDFSVPMEQIGPGHYRAEVSFPLLGVWDILISAKHGEDEFNLPHRISAGVK